MSKTKSKDPTQTQSPSNPMKRKLRSSTQHLDTRDENPVEPEAEFEDTIVVSPRPKPKPQLPTPTKQTAASRAQNTTKADEDPTAQALAVGITSDDNRPSYIPPERWAELSHKAKRHARETARKNGVVGVGGEGSG